MCEHKHQKPALKQTKPNFPPENYTETSAFHPTTEEKKKKAAKKEEWKILKNPNDVRLQHAQ